MATRGRRSILSQFIDAVLADPAATELIVVIDGYDNETFEYLTGLAEQLPRLVPVQVEHLGQHGALDVGVWLARSEVILLLDDDVVVGPGLVTGHARHHAHRSGIVVLGFMPVGHSSTGHVHVGAVLYSQEYLGHCAAIEQGDLAVLDGLWGGNVSLRREDCLRVGLRSQRFPLHYHADKDLGLRLADAGLTGVYDSALAATHLHSSSDDTFLRNAQRQGAGAVLVHQIHADRLGHFDHLSLVSDLPHPLQLIVRITGNSPMATKVCRVLLVAGTLAGRLGLRNGELVAAKFARRIMMWHGTVVGEDRPVSHAPVTV